MKRDLTRIFAVLAVVLALVFGIGPMGGVRAAEAADSLNGAGASFPYPVYSTWAFAYRRATRTKVNYQSIGSGGGQRQIMARTVHFGASDAPLASEKVEEEKLLQFPAVIGGVVPVVNVSGIREGMLRLDGKALCGIFLGKINKWNDPAISALNPAVKLPGKNINVVHRSDGSGTTAIFSTYLAEVCPEWKEKVGAGKALDWPVGIGGKGNEGVANYVRRSRNSIGFIEFAYAKQNKLNHVNLKNKSGNFVAPSIESFKAAAAGGDFDPEKHFHLWLVNAQGEDAWPIGGATFILLARDQKESNRQVVEFFDWAFKNGDRMAENLVYVPLPDSLKEKVRAYWKENGIY